MSESKNKIVVNAATVKIAGGLIVAYDLIQLLVNQTDIKVVLICPSIKKFRNLPSNITRIYTPELLLKSYLRWILDYFWLKKQIRSLSPNLLITLGNLPARTSVKQLMLNDNAFVSQKYLNEIPLSITNLVKHYLRRRFFWNRLKFVNTLLVQTQTEYKRLISFNKPLPEIKVLAPLLPKHLREESKKTTSLPNKSSNIIRIGCISYYWDHKNIEILIEVLKLASLQGFPLQLIFTLNEKKIKGGKKIIQQLQPFLKSNMAINIGNIPQSKITSVVSECDGIILPSLLETFGLNSLEAWRCNKPFFVADKPYAREVCKNAAIYFDPTNAEHILSTLIASFKNKTLLENLIKNGSDKIKYWDNEKDYITLVKNSISE